jgi:uncharacterized protein (DUF2147 family)
MKNKLILTLLMLVGVNGFGQSAIGKWKTIDDKTGKPKSIVEISERNGIVYGKIIQLFREPNEDPNPKCTECTDDRKNQPAIGMEILRDMKWTGSMYENGNICDPKNGTVYTCEMWLKSGDPNTLEVRGYWGFVYRTQNWQRVK